MFFTLTNDFHGTSTRIRVGADMIVSARTCRRAWRDLCGIDDCTCSGIANMGTRGHQDGIADYEHVSEDGDIRIVPEGDQA